MLFMYERWTENNFNELEEEGDDDDDDDDVICKKRNMKNSNSLPQNMRNAISFSPTTKKTTTTTMT